MAKRKRYSVEQIVRKLREAEAEISRGQTVGQVCRKLGVDGDQAQAIKASGAIVSLEPMQFERLLRRAESPLVVAATGGRFSTHYKYIMGHRGLAFYAKSPEPLRLPEGTRPSEPVPSTCA